MVAACSVFRWCDEKGTATRVTLAVPLCVGHRNSSEAICRYETGDQIFENWVQVQVSDPLFSWLLLLAQGALKQPRGIDWPIRMSCSYEELSWPRRPPHRSGEDRWTRYLALNRLRKALDRADSAVCCF